MSKSKCKFIRKAWRGLRTALLPGAIGCLTLCTVLGAWALQNRYIVNFAGMPVLRTLNYCDWSFLPLDRIYQPSKTAS
jgi:hypothetical protein